MDPLQCEPYRSKLCTAQDAARKIQPGFRVFVGTACATPRALVQALEDLPRDGKGLYSVVSDQQVTA